MNDFEVRLAISRGKMAVKDLIASLIAADLALPSAAAFEEDWTGFQPLLFSKNGVPMLACFSAKERAVEFSKIAPYCLLINGAELLRRIPAGHGLVVNPGQRIGFDVSPEGITQIRADFLFSDLSGH